MHLYSPILTIIFFCSMQSHALIGGEPALSEDYNAVGSLRPINEAGTHCTATLVSEKWIVTALHCLEGGDEADPTDFKTEDMVFLIGPTQNSPFLTAQLKRWVKIPGVFRLDQEKKALDLIFAELKKPIRDKRINPIPIIVKTNKNYKNTKFELVGFGSEDTFGYEGEGLRKKGSVQMTSTSGAALLNIFELKSVVYTYLKHAFPGEEGDVDRHVYNSKLIKGYTAHVWDSSNRNIIRKYRPNSFVGSCYGDSGGPLLSKDSKGNLNLAGVIFAGFPGATHSCTPLGTIVSIFGPKVQEVMKKEGIPFLLN